MDHEQFQFARIQMFTTAMIAVGAVFISMGVSNITFVESSNLSLLQFETTLMLEPGLYSELIDSVNSLRDALQNRMDHAWIFTVSGTVLLMGGILFGSIGFYRLTKH